MAKVVNPAYADILKQLKGDSPRGDVQYLKDGDTTLKLVMPKDRTDVRGFYEKFNSKFPNGVFPYYLVAAVVIEASEPDVADPTCIRFVKVPKTIMFAIYELLTAGWKLFELESNVLVIKKGKKNNQAAYSLTPIMDEKFDATGLPHPETSIEDAAKEQQEASFKMDAAGNVTGKVSKAGLLGEAPF